MCVARVGKGMVEAIMKPERDSKYKGELKAERWEMVILRTVDSTTSRDREAR